MAKHYHTCNYCGANLDPGEHCDCCQSTASERVVEGVDALASAVCDNICHKLDGVPEGDDAASICEECPMSSPMVALLNLCEEVIRHGN